MILCSTCRNKDICTVYKFIADITPNVRLKVENCKYFINDISVTQHIGNRQLGNILETSEKIKAIQDAQKRITQDAPQTIKALRGTGMSFTVDDESVS